MERGKGRGVPESPNERSVKAGEVVLTLEPALASMGLGRGAKEVSVRSVKNPGMVGVTTGPDATIFRFVIDKILFLKTST